MIQQVNLFHAGLNQDSGKKVLNYYSFTFILTVLMLGSYCGFIYWHTASLQTDLEYQRAELQKTEAHLQQLKINFPKPQINKLLVSEVALAQSKLNAASKIIAMLTDHLSDQSLGFSRYWLALAKQTQEQIWLNKILINIEQQNLTLQGSTFEPESVALLLLRLQNEPVFQGKNFTTLSMQQAQPQTEQIDFTLSTASLEATQP